MAFSDGLITAYCNSPVQRSLKVKRVNLLLQDMIQADLIVNDTWFVSEKGEKKKTAFMGKDLFVGRRTGLNRDLNRHFPPFFCFNEQRVVLINKSK